MSRPRQAIALVAIGLTAGVVGFAGAAAIDDAGSTAPGPAPSAAVSPPPAQTAAAAPAPAAAATDPADPAAPPEAPGPPATAPSPAPAPRTTPRRRARTATTAPRTPTAPPATTAPAPAPAPPAETAPASTAAAPPAGPPTRALQEPAAPPVGVRIPAGAAPGGVDAAHRALAGALAAAAPGSTEAADIRRSLDLWRAYLAPGAPGAPDGRRATAARALRANAWWFSRRRSPTDRVLLRDADGVILTYRAGQGFAVNPVATTGRWQGLNDDVPAAELAAALLPMGVSREDGGTEFRLWEYYDVEGDPTAIVPGASGMAQARVALLMAHAQAETGDPRFADAALQALRAFAVGVDRGGVRSMVSIGDRAPMPWYVERAYPGENPWKGGALNGFMVTLLNLQGAAGILERAPGGGPAGTEAVALARRLAADGSRTLQDYLPDHDSGAWSYYGLLTPGRPWHSYLADLNYHCYHVRLLAQLAGIFPGMGFQTTSDRWQGYVDQAGLTCPSR